MMDFYASSIELCCCVEHFTYADLAEIAVSGSNLYALSLPCFCASETTLVCSFLSTHRSFPAVYPAVVDSSTVLTTLQHICLLIAGDGFEPPFQAKEACKFPLLYPALFFIQMPPSSHGHSEIRTQDRPVMSRML